MDRKQTQSLNDALQEFLLNNNELRERMYLHKIQQAWGQVLGPSIMQYTKNIYVRNRTMHVTLTSSVLRNELILNREKLIKSLNNHAGHNVIDNIILR